MMASYLIVKGKRIRYDGIHNGIGCAMPEIDWTARVKGILKAELKRRGLSYHDLAEKLAEIGVRDAEPNIRNKVARGSFTAVFFVQCLVAIGAHTVRLKDD